MCSVSDRSVQLGFAKVLQAREDYIKLHNLQNIASLDVQHCAAVFQVLRMRYLEEEAVFSQHTMNIRKFGADMAQRRLRSSHRTALRRKFGHAVVVAVLVKLGRWSPEFATNLADEQKRRLQDTWQVTNPPGTCITANGRRRVKGPQKASKRKRYYIKLGDRISPGAETRLTSWSRYNLQRGRNGQLAQAAATAKRLQGPDRSHKPLLPIVIGEAGWQRERQQDWQPGWQGWQPGWQEWRKEPWQEWRKEPWQGASSETVGGPSGFSLEEVRQDHGRSD